MYRSWPEVETVRFLANSSTLSRQLPSEAEADHFNIAGTIQELHLPAGGIIHLNTESAAQLGIRFIEMIFIVIEFKYLKNFFRVHPYFSKISQTLV